MTTHLVQAKHQEALRSHTDLKTLIFTVASKLIVLAHTQVGLGL